MTAMIAAIAEAPGGPAVLETTSTPKPEPGPGEVRIRVEAAAVNFSDVMRRRASPYPFPTTFPYVPGAEVAGVIDAHGPGVTEPALGTPVFAVVGQGGEGGYAQYALTGASRAFPIPPGIEPEVAAGLVIAGVTAVAMLREVARLQPGETVLVPAAAGGVGSLLVQVARVLEAGRIIALASNEEKRATARALGADVALDPADPHLADQVREAAPEGIDVLFEMEGGTALDQRLGWLAPFGRAVVYGAAGSEPRRLSGQTLDSWLSTPALNQSVIAFNLGGLFGGRPAWAGAATQALIGWVLDGRVAVPVGHVLPLARAAEAHELLESRRSTGKIVLDPWPQEDPRTVAEARGYRFELSHGGGVLAFRWTADTADLTTDGFQRALEHYASIAERYRPRGLLVDVAQLRFPGPPPAEGWREAAILPRYVAAGALRMAYVGVSEAEASPRRYGTFEEQRHAHEADALAWLQEVA